MIQSHSNQETTPRERGVTSNKHNNVSFGCAAKAGCVERMVVRTLRLLSIMDTLMTPMLQTRYTRNSLCYMFVA